MVDIGLSTDLLYNVSGHGEGRHRPFDGTGSHQGPPLVVVLEETQETGETLSSEQVGLKLTSGACSPSLHRNR